MQRPVRKPKAKHVLRATRALRKLGAIDIVVAISGHDFLSWISPDAALRIGLARTAGRSAFERAMSEIRAQLLLANLVVPG